MKLTVVTVCRNARATVAEAVDSVHRQTHPDVEHIVIDGASTDDTLAVVRRHGARVAQIRCEPDRGVYDAMNKGVALASGEVVGFLNADDVYTGPQVLARVAAILAAPELDACYADLVYVDKDRAQRIVRQWTSCDYRSGLFERGWMPAHPTFFARRSVYQRFGGFNLRYRLQSDFDLLMRFMAVHGIRTRYVPETWVRMRMGGMSNRSIRNVIRGNLEAYAACRANGLGVPPWFIVTKVLSRLPQFIRARRMRTG